MISRWVSIAVAVFVWMASTVSGSADGLVLNKIGSDAHVSLSSLTSLETFELLAEAASIDGFSSPTCPSPENTESELKTSRLALMTQKDYSVFSIRFVDHDTSTGPDISAITAVEPTLMPSTHRHASQDFGGVTNGEAVALRLRLFNSPLVTDGSDIVLSSDLFLPVSWNDIRQYIWSLCLSSQKQWALNADIIVDQPPLLVNGIDIQDQADPQSLAFASGMNYRFNEHLLVEMTYYRLHWQKVGVSPSILPNTPLVAAGIEEYAVAHLHIRF
jgi:hypothetical protein